MRPGGGRGGGSDYSNSTLSFFCCLEMSLAVIPGETEIDVRERLAEVFLSFFYFFRLLTRISTSDPTCRIVSPPRELEGRVCWREWGGVEGEG